MTERSLNRTRTEPLPVRRSTRFHDIRALTSLPAGRMVPIAAIPVLREDAVTQGVMRLEFDMKETVQILMNAVNVNVKAYLVPNLAMERFRGSMDSLNRSYEGIPEKPGDPVIPYIETELAPADVSGNHIHKYLGVHARTGTPINMAYTEAYNLIWNFRAANRSPKITKRLRLQADLAKAFWQHQGFSHIVPNFDQKLIDGEVALNVLNNRLPVKGIGYKATNASPAVNQQTYEHGGVTVYPRAFQINTAATAVGNATVNINANITSNLPEIWAEMQQNGVTISLSNIELAKKTQAYAKLRAQYAGLKDEYIIDLLMDGISIPDQAWKQPILLADRSTVFGMSKRYASDAANLTESVVNGATFIDLSMVIPKVPTGGVIMVVAEITPEQIFERQKDPYLHTTNVNQLPQFLRDELDPEKVVIVPNDYVDIDHTTPNDVFGYAPLNHEWSHTSPKIGGKFYRPKVNAGFDEDRQRLWAVETANPILSEDFYLATTMHTKPFVVTNQDPFECLTRGMLTITGNTVFGGALVEGSKDYAEVLAEAPQTRITKPAV